MRNAGTQLRPLEALLLFPQKVFYSELSSRQLYAGGHEPKKKPSKVPGMFTPDLSSGVDAANEWE